jgi:hypothetical protein
MVEYHCPNCGEIFNKKSNYNYHINRKRPCVKITPIAPEITPNVLEIVPNTFEKPHNELLCEVKPINSVIEIKTNEIGLKEYKNKPIIANGKNNKIFCCEFCNQIFSRKFCLDRHLNNNKCKMKLNQEQQKEDTNSNNPNQNDNKLNEYENILTQYDNKYNFILKRLNDLENENKKLKMKIKKTKKTTNININQPNINLNQNNILINFNDLKLEDIDKKLFTIPLLNTKLHGKHIILQMIENVYINESHTEYQNILITDKNRGYIKIYNNGKWKTDNINTINIIIDGIINHSKNILVELKQQYINNLGARTRLNTSEKYVNLCDLEYLGDLEDEQLNEDVNNNNQIKRCKEFREMVYKDTINLFHDNKNLLLKPKNNKVIF